MKYEETKTLIKDVMDPDRMPEKVPLSLNLQNWIVYGRAGYGFTEAVYDGNKVLDAYSKAIHDFPADIYYDMGGFASMFISRCLGSEDYYLNEDNYAMNFLDIHYCSTSEDLEALAADPKAFLWNHFYEKKFKNLSPDKLEETLANYLELSQKHYENSQLLEARLKEETGTFFLSDIPMYQPAFDYLFQYIIGIKGISMAMRRNSDALIDALGSTEHLLRGYFDCFTPALKKDDMPLQMQICLLGNAITNPRQFEKFIWPQLGSVVDYIAKNDLKVYFMVEGTLGALGDYLAEFPKGSCILHVEIDSIDDLKARYGDRFTYMGGMPVAVLGGASMEECAKQTRDILERYAHDGNFIFSTNKGVVFKNDATEDNLKTVCDVVNNFSA